MRVVFKGQVMEKLLKLDKEKKQVECVKVFVEGSDHLQVVRRVPHNTVETGMELNFECNMKAFPSGAGVNLMFDCLSVNY